MGVVVEGANCVGLFRRLPIVTVCPWVAEGTGNKVQ